MGTREHRSRRRRNHPLRRGKAIYATLLCGCPGTPLFRYWGETPFAKGDIDGAMELLAPEAVLMNDEEAGVLLKQAYVAKQGSDRDYDQFTWMLRKKLGPRNDDFTLPDYEGNEMSLSSLHGRVILLAFWFPT